MEGVVQGQLVGNIDALGGPWGIIADEGMNRLARSTARKGLLSGVPVLGMPCPLCRPLVMTPGANLPPFWRDSVVALPYFPDEKVRMS